MFIDPLIIGSGISRYFFNHPEVKRFLWYFEKSPILQHFILGHFRRYMNDERAAIDQDVENFINEADQDFPWLNNIGKDKI